MSSEKEDPTRAYNVGAKAVFASNQKYLAEANRLYAEDKVEEALLVTKLWGQGRGVQMLVESRARECGQPLDYQDPWSIS